MESENNTFYINNRTKMCLGGMKWKTIFLRLIMIGFGWLRMGGIYRSEMVDVIGGIAKESWILGARKGCFFSGARTVTSDSCVFQR